MRAFFINSDERCTKEINFELYNDGTHPAPEDSDEIWKVLKQTAQGQIVRRKDFYIAARLLGQNR